MLFTRELCSRWRSVLVALVCLVALVGLMALVGLVALMGLVDPDQCYHLMISLKIWIYREKNNNNNMWRIPQLT